MHRDEAEGGKRPDGIEDIAARVRRVTEMTLERVDCVTRGTTRSYRGSVTSVTR